MLSNLNERLFLPEDLNLIPRGEGHCLSFIVNKAYPLAAFLTVCVIDLLNCLLLCLARESIPYGLGDCIKGLAADTTFLEEVLEFRVDHVHLLDIVRRVRCVGVAVG